MLIVANWKMHPLRVLEAEKWFKSISKSSLRIKKTKVVICAPTLYLSSLKNISRRISLGAQNAFAGDVGPFTGEISAEMLYEAGARYVILGHSERRALGEDNALINKKLKGVLAASLTPLLCVGETTRDESHDYFNLVKNQLGECVKNISRDLLPKIAVAYEPIWSISSTKHRRDATAADSREMAVFIRKVLSDLSSPEVAQRMKVIYGGSVNEKDAEEFVRDGGVDGLLVGKASLDPKKFAEIIKIAESIS